MGFQKPPRSRLTPHDQALPPHSRLMRRAKSGNFPLAAFPDQRVSILARSFGAGEMDTRVVENRIGVRVDDC
jgi:hypothetical protein